MSSTLYVTDLDGTLLNAKQSLEPRALEVLNQMLREGLPLAVATARTPATAVPLLGSMDFSLPAVCMNGAVYWDLKQNLPVRIFRISEDAVQAIEAVLSRHRRSAFAYAAPSGPVMDILYRHDLTAGQRSFMQMRRHYTGKRYVLLDADIKLTEADLDFVFFSMVDTREVLLPVWKEMEQIPGIRTSLYPDVYTGFMLLEIFSEEADKAAGIRFLKEHTGAERVVVFGDNHNDLSMFRAADEGIAVENAVPEIRSAAGEIIGTCDDASVVWKLHSLWREPAKVQGIPRHGYGTEGHGRTGETRV